MEELILTATKTSFTLEELELAREILNINAPIPPPCICGKRDFRFSIWKNHSDGTIVYLKSQCRDNACRYQRYYLIATGMWGPVFLNQK
jgi:hypothetical protein